MKWTVIASRAGANIYKLDEDKNSKLIHEIPYPLGRERNRAMQDDAPGFSRSGSIAHSTTGNKDPHDQAADQFALQLTKFLQAEWLKHHFSQLQVVAEPKLLGKIKRDIHGVLEDHIEWVAKDLKNIPEKNWPASLTL